MKYECIKWHHSEIRIAINNESQGSIAKNFRCDELFVKIGKYLVKLWDTEFRHYAMAKMPVD